MKKKYILIIIFSILFSLCHYASAYSRDKRILVIVAKEKKQYSFAMQTIKEFFIKNETEVLWETYTLKNDREKKKVLKILTGLNTGMVIVIGSGAVRFVSTLSLKIPIIYTMVMKYKTQADDEKNRLPENVTGVSLIIEPDVWLKTIKNLDLYIENVGVIYNPEHTAQLVKKASEAATILDLSLTKIKINSTEEIKDALRSVKNKIDILWAVADSTTLNTLSVKQLLYFSLREKIPLITVSPSIVRAGALLSLSNDYKSIGLQTGKIARQVFLGMKPMDIPAVSPENTFLSVNLNTARILGISIPSKIVKEAKYVFKK